MDKNELRKPQVFSADFKPLKIQWCSFSWTVWGGNPSSGCSDPAVQLLQGAASRVTWHNPELPPGTTAAGSSTVSSFALPGTQLQALQKPRCSFPAPQQSQLPCLAINTSHLISPMCLTHVLNKLHDSDPMALAVLALLGKMQAACSFCSTLLSSFPLQLPPSSPHVLSFSFAQVCYQSSSLFTGCAMKYLWYWPQSCVPLCVTAYIDTCEMGNKQTINLKSCIIL